jgi:hypothetical protein
MKTWESGVAVLTEMLQVSKETQLIQQQVQSQL